MMLHAATNPTVAATAAESSSSNIAAGEITVKNGSSNAAAKRHRETLTLRLALGPDTFSLV